MWVSMFAYLRSFYFITFCLVFIGAFVVGVYFRAAATNDLIRSAEQKNAVILARSYVNNIWSKYQGTLDSLSSSPLKEWAKDENFKEFYKESFRFFKEVPLVKFSIYTPKKELFFSTNLDGIAYTGGWWHKLSPYHWLYHTQETTVFSQAVEGKTVNRIIAPARKYSRKSMVTAGRVTTVQSGSFVQVLIPILGEAEEGGRPPVDAVIEVYYDVSEPWSYLFRFQVVGTASIIIFVSILYLALLYVSRRAERIIAKQHETNIMLTEAKVRAETASEEKSKFLANVSHELRTPLNAIIGFSQIIKDEVNGSIGNEQYKDYIRDIYNSGSHLLSLINDILDFSKAEANKLEVEQVDIDLNKTIKSCIRLVTPRAEEAKVQLVEKVPKDHIILKADSKRMKQILLNLLSNSVKFTPEGGTVTLAARIDTDGSLVIEVNDTGIGIAQKDISKAMATFGQVDSTLSRRFEGTGLGLPLTKKLVELMGGMFDIQSEVGLGTTVTIRFDKEKLSTLAAFGV